MFAKIENYKIVFYSVLNASTGSFLLATIAGINPPINVRIKLTIINNKAWYGFIRATFSKSVNSSKIALAGISKSLAIIIPNNPDVSPIINVSALNTRVTSFLRAPKALNIPISLVLSKTDI